MRSKPGTKCLGKRPAKEPSRRVRYDRAQLIPEVFLVDMCAVFRFQFSYSKFHHSNHRIGAHTCTNYTVPYRDGTFGWRCPSHFVPGYDRTVPPGRVLAGAFRPQF